MVQFKLAVIPLCILQDALLQFEHKLDPTEHTKCHAFKKLQQHNFVTKSENLMSLLT